MYIIRTCTLESLPLVIIIEANKFHCACELCTKAQASIKKKKVLLSTPKLVRVEDFKKACDASNKIINNKRKSIQLF